MGKQLDTKETQIDGKKIGQLENVYKIVQQAHCSRFDSRETVSRLLPAWRSVSPSAEVKLHERSKSIPKLT